MRPFEICGERVFRALHHSNTAATLWNNTGVNDLYRAEIHFNPETGAGDIRVKVTNPHLLFDISFELGEMLYQLRAALDGIVYESALLESGSDPPPNERRLQFPICSTPEDFANSKRCIAPLAMPCKNFIESVQPFNQPFLSNDQVVKNVQRTLGMLGDLSRKDRHRSLHIVGIVPRNFQPEFRLPAGMTVKVSNLAPEGLTIQDNSRIAVFEIDSFRRDLNIAIRPNLLFALGVAGEPQQVAANDHFSERATMMIQHAAGILDWFKEFHNITATNG